MTMDEQGLAGGRAQLKNLEASDHALAARSANQRSRVVIWEAHTSDHALAARSANQRVAGSDLGGTHFRSRTMVRDT